MICLLGVEFLYRVPSVSLTRSLLETLITISTMIRLMNMTKILFLPKNSCHYYYMCYKWSTTSPVQKGLYYSSLWNIMRTLISIMSDKV